MKKIILSVLFSFILSSLAMAQLSVTTTGSEFATQQSVNGTPGKTVVGVVVMCLNSSGVAVPTNQAGNCPSGGSSSSNITQWNTVALGSPTAWGVAPSGNVIGANVNCVVGCSSGTVSNAGSGVATSSTNNGSVSYNYGFNGTNWDQLQVDASKFLKVNISAGNITGFGTAANQATLIGVAGTTTTAHSCAIAGYTMIGCLGQIDDDIKGNIPGVTGPLAASSSGLATFSLITGAQYLSTQPTMSNLQQGSLLMSSRGELLVSPGTSGFTVALNTTPSLANGNGTVPTQGGAVLSATNGSYSNILQGNAALSTGNPLFAQLTAGSAIAGKFGIDQTTPGTTNAVSATNLPTTLDTNSGNKSASTVRFVLATDQPQLTNKLLVTPDSVALPANQSVNTSQVNGVTTLTGTGASGTGAQRVTVATDQATNAGAALVKGGVGVVNGGSTYQAVAASQTATVLQTSTGAIGDYLSHCDIYPTSTSPGVVTVFDNANAAATNVIAFPGGASSVSNLVPFPIPVGAVSTAGAWKVTTGAAVSVVCYGKFS